MLFREGQFNEIEKEEVSTMTIEEIIHFLKNQEFNPETSSMKFEVTGEVSVESIKKLLRFPFEIIYWNEGSKLFFRTGTEHGFHNLKKGERDNTMSSEFTFHTHVSKYGKGQKSMSTPSISDAYKEIVSGSENRRAILAHSDGLIEFQKPHLNPVNGEEYKGDLRDLFVFYSDQVNVDMLKIQPGLKKYDDLSGEDQVKLQREFAEKTGMIIEEVSWDDQENIERLMRCFKIEGDKKTNDFIDKK